ncbi:hypothetical protein EPD60_15450 [Flaviaesturariibacter flavus]|uniref:Uncharacterized protein n=1 Tax=Flaviaesturariibacter flavus TaxID=2502780 RepID=A0A4R1B7Q8_9BACT|nr:hypothetical protein [Flaviaesturariibacter flavus]TCJ12658.1 hypothetical protein EPD60_15450 [Flaviaesturariibacter flavus]
MNQEQDNFLEMLGNTQLHCDAHRPYWTHLLPVSESVQALTETKREIDLCALVQTDGTSGSKAAKDMALELSAGKSYTMGRRVLAWAKKTGRADVVAAVDFSKSDLLQGAEADLLQRHRLIHRYASDNKAELAAYQVTDEALTALETAINTFDALRGGYKEKGNHRIYCTGRIDELIGKAREILDILDDEVEGLIENKEFIETYFIARRKTDRRATRSTAAAGSTAATGA